MICLCGQARRVVLRASLALRERRPGMAGIMVQIVSENEKSEVLDEDMDTVMAKRGLFLASVTQSRATR